MNIRLQEDPDGVATLVFDRQGSSANVFDRATLFELEGHLLALERRTGLRGLLLVSAKPAIFIAGADLHSLADAATPAALGGLVDMGHDVFNRLARLPVPSVAAIHGSCLGGGLELALACDWRIASSDEKTRLGLPETQLGILPAWGGSVRLPALVGLPAAWSLILTGRQISGKEALRLGAVDALGHAENLPSAARGLLERGKRPARRRPWMNRWPARVVAAAVARRDVLAKTGGHYPAPLKAVEVCAAAAGCPEDQGFALEKAALLELAATPVCRNLLALFFLRERAKKLVVTDAGELPVRPVRRVAVVGAGLMGAGIAHWVAASGRRVLLGDIAPDAVGRGLQTIGKLVAEAMKRKKLTRAEGTAVLDRITPLPPGAALRGVDLVIEAAVEKLEVKQAIFREIEAQVSTETILATNTSALSIEALAVGLARPERVVGLHFFNPVHRMPLLEIVRGPRTSAGALAVALQFAHDIGKLPVIVRDSPGFLVNRILMPGLVEAVHWFTEGAGVAEIDRVMRDFGLPMGPLRLADEVGLDVALHVARDLAQRLPHLRAPGDNLEQMVGRGWLGRKSGCGFYVHGAKGSMRPNPDLDSLPHPARRPAQNVVEGEPADRIVLLTINEAARCLDEGVVAAAEDVDFAMILGTGWAPFRGGPLRYADSLGAAAGVRRLEARVGLHGPHFEPCARLRAMAEDGRTFYPLSS